MTRTPARAAARIGGILLTGLLLAACGATGQATAPDAGADSGTAPDAGADPGTATPASGAHPVSVAHVYGTAEIPAAPQRVVSVGFTDHDAALALGVVPIAVRDWYGDQPSATWPWARDELGDEEPVVLPAGELDVEAIAALQPDLILGISSGMTAEEHATLSRIAPTVARPPGYVPYGTPWQEQTRVIGAALGLATQAEERSAEVEAAFADARAAHPELEGATGAVVMVNGDGTYSVYSPQDVRGRFLSSLGVQLPDTLAELAGDSFFAAVSAEQVDLLDLDVVVFAVDDPADAEAVRSDPLVAGLEGAAAGRHVFLAFTDEAAGAISLSSVLSLPGAIDALVPRLAAAVDGDPSTGTDA
jgi:iron complex transport system substrate-binding protein